MKQFNIGLLFVIVLVSCAPSENVIQTAISRTQTVFPTVTTKLTVTPSGTSESSQKPTKLPTLTPTVTPTFTSIPPNSILFQRNFEDGAVGKWSYKDGVWAIEQEPDGNHCLSGSVSSVHPPQIWYNENILWTDYALETRVKFIKGHTLYILIRSDDGFSEHYGVALNDIGFSLMRTWSIISNNIPISLDPSRWYTIRVEIKGNYFSAYIDSDVFLENKLLSPTIPQGGFGYVIDNGDNACFDDIKVWSLK